MIKSYQLRKKDGSEILFSDCTEIGWMSDDSQNGYFMRLEYNVLSVVFLKNGLERIKIVDTNYEITDVIPCVSNYKNELIELGFKNEKVKWNMNFEKMKYLLSKNTSQ